jgi:hypothetical protein
MAEVLERGEHLLRLPPQGRAHVCGGPRGRSTVLHDPLPVWQAALPADIEASVKVIGIVFLFVPMQVGVSETAYAVVFNAIGLPAAAGFAVAFLRRARSLAVAGIGLSTLAVLTRHRERRIA